MQRTTTTKFTNVIVDGGFVVDEIDVGHHASSSFGDDVLDILVVLLILILIVLFTFTFTFFETAIRQLSRFRSGR
jgi:hypothetical protein